MSTILPTPPPNVPNHLLANLTENEITHFLSGCDRVELKFAQVLAIQGESIAYVYFPISGYISLRSAIENKEYLEVGMIGNEGMLGASLLLGIAATPLHALVQGEGEALWMDRATFQTTIETLPAFRNNIKRYLYVLICQYARTAACTHFHRLEKRLARWLLMMQDRSSSAELRVTQQFLAEMLGVRRVGITQAAIALQTHQLIHYRRGHIQILDRAKLEQLACSCYAADKAIYQHAMSQPILVS